MQRLCNSLHPFLETTSEGVSSCCTGSRFKVTFSGLAERETRRCKCSRVAAGCSNRLVSFVLLRECRCHPFLPLLLWCRPEHSSLPLLQTYRRLLARALLFASFARSVRVCYSTGITDASSMTPRTHPLSGRSFIWAVYEGYDVAGIARADFTIHEDAQHVDWPGIT